MTRHCRVCGKELKKTAGDIGPKCLQKIQPKNRRIGRTSKQQYIKIWSKYDLYGDANGPREGHEPQD